MAESKSQKPSFEDSMKKLEGIVADLEQGEFGLEESVDKFEQGLELGKRCKKILQKAQQKVKTLVRDSEGELVEEDYEDDA